MIKRRNQVAAILTATFIFELGFILGCNYASDWARENESLLRPDIYS